jgi:hypothetical protein
MGRNPTLFLPCGRMIINQQGFPTHQYKQYRNEYK